MSQIDAIDERHKTAELHAAEELRTYWVIFAWLMGLLIVTVAAAQLNLDRLFPGLNVIVALIIAAVKGLLVVLFFMHVKHASKLTWMFASAAFVWFAILIALSFNDYLTREQVQPLAVPSVHRTQTQEHEKGFADQPVSKEER
jgi:cytochrome c oxidase subunit IV